METKASSFILHGLQKRYVAKHIGLHSILKVLLWKAYALSGLLVYSIASARLTIL